MKKLSEVITLVAGLTENEALTNSMIDYAESDSCNQITVNRQDVPFTEFHDAEGIYEFKFQSNPVTEQALARIAISANSLYSRSRNEEFDNHLKFFTGLTVDEVATRKTKDGQKLWKQVSKNLKMVEKKFHLALGSYFQVIEYLYLNQNVLSTDELEMFGQSARYANSEITDAYYHLNNLKERIAELEKLDQQNKTASISETIYARLSFRRQDVLGMTHLGNYSSCQNLMDGFSSHAKSVVASLLSPDLGTLTIHETMESATARDNFSNHRPIYRNDNLQAIARDNIIKDAYGNIIPNGHVYGRENKVYSMMQAVKDAFYSLDIFKEDLTGRPNLFTDEYSFEVTYDLEREITFNVFGNVDMDDLIYNVTTDNELSEETVEQLESDDLTEDEKLDIIENLGLMDDVMQYVVDQLDDVELPEWSYDFPVVGDDWREISVSDDSIMYEVDTDDIKSIGYDEIYYNWSRDELQDALECGTVSVYVGYNVRMDFEDCGEEYVTPYDEGEISRWV